MNYPAQGQYPPQQGYPPPPQQQPQQGYLQGYPPAQPQGYPPPQQGYYPPPQQQGYGAPPGPAQQAAQGSIDDFYGQPSASGKSISFDRKPPGTKYTGFVSRSITRADIQHQTDVRKTLLYHPDGRPKYVMIVPLSVQPSAEFPEGRAAWYVKGADRTELERAMEASGVAPGTPPEAGALISITYVGDRPIPGLNAQKVKSITYQRPAGVSGAPAPIAAEAVATPPEQYAQTAPFNGGQQYADPTGQAAADMVNGNGHVPNGQYVPQEQAAHYGQPQAGYAPQQVEQLPPGQYAPTQPVYAAPGQQLPPVEYAAVQQAGPPPGQGMAPSQTPAQPAQQWAAPSDLTAEQQERLRQLTGN